jgi:hypothetical protein
LFFKQYLNPIALDNLHSRYYIFYCCFLAVEVVVIWLFYVETRYVPLEEMTKIFDGEDVAAVANLEIEKMGDAGKGFTTAVHVEEARA